MTATGTPGRALWPIRSPTFHLTTSTSGGLPLPFPSPITAYHVRKCGQQPFRTQPVPLQIGLRIPRPSIHSYPITWVRGFSTAKSSYRGSSDSTSVTTQYNISLFPDGRLQPLSLPGKFEYCNDDLARANTAQRMSAPTPSPVHSLWAKLTCE